MSITFTAAAPGAPALNVSNGNAAELLELLGLPAQPEGDCAAEDFLGRVLVAQALGATAVDDVDGRPEVHEGRWVWGGRPAGYLAYRLAELHALATWAVEHQTLVCWW